MRRTALLACLLACLPPAALAANPPAPSGFGSWMERFLDAGFSKDDVRRMVQTNPAEVLG